ncbi:MAG: hypothetical protein JXA42_18715 [Anaerolineales bacterium]|nr:hypothetical protein [Anaerolineales bacterium]
MTTLFSYRVRHDYGSAPNPFWGVCTLVLCKPVIRRAAEVGDWVIGFGSSQSPAGDLSGKVVYVMQVTCKMTMEAYDQYTRDNLPGKVPDLESTDPKRWAGDSVYDFSSRPVKKRPGAHDDDKAQQARDLAGKYALLSTCFWYYGRDAIQAPVGILPFDPKRQGHRSHANGPYIDVFKCWIESFAGKPHGLVGLPESDDFGMDWRGGAGVDMECDGRRGRAQRCEPGSSPMTASLRPYNTAGGCHA